VAKSIAKAQVKDEVKYKKTHESTKTDKSLNLFTKVNFIPCNFSQPKSRRDDEPKKLF